MNINALMTHKSYCYLTQPDFLNAFGEDETVLIARKARQFELILDEQKGRYSSALIRGNVVHPVTFLMVNDEKKTISNNEKDIGGSIDEQDEMKTQKLFTEEGPKNIDSILLFRRRLRTKSMKELSKDELEKIARNVLTRNRHKDKSKFSYVSENRLVHDEDYTNPAFLQINQPADTEYEDNYSEEAPSIHDLFDLNVSSIAGDSQKFDNDDDEDMIEEYIFDEFDEGEYEIMQQ